MFNKASRHLDSMSLSLSFFAENQAPNSNQSIMAYSLPCWTTEDFSNISSKRAVLYCGRARPRPLLAHWCRKSLTILRKITGFDLPSSERSNQPFECVSFFIASCSALHLWQKGLLPHKAAWSSRQIKQIRTFF